MNINILSLSRKYTFRYIVLLFALSFVIVYRHINQPTSGHLAKLYSSTNDNIRNQEYIFTIPNATLMSDVNRSSKPPFDSNLAIAPDEPMLHSVWHVIRLWQDDIMYVKAGYYDDRLIDESGAFIRVMTQSSVKTHTKLIETPPYCYVTCPDKRKPREMNVIFKVQSDTSHRHLSKSPKRRVAGVDWHNTFISCPVPHNDTRCAYGFGECYLAFSNHPTNLTSSTWLPVVFPEKPKDYISEIGEMA